MNDTFLILSDTQERINQINVIKIKIRKPFCTNQTHHDILV